MTNQLATLAVKRGEFARPEDAIEAQKFLSERFPGIVYDDQTDSFIYRDYRLNYFKSGIMIDKAGIRQHAYALVSPYEGQQDPEQIGYEWGWACKHRNWLKDSENWAKFMEKEREFEKKLEVAKQPRSWWSKFFYV